MRAFFTTLLSLVLVASLATATSTVPRVVNSSSIPLTCLAGTTAGSTTRYSTYPCYQHVPDGLQFQNVQGRWNASQADLGWDYLEISYTGSSYDYWYRFGVLEGMLTAERIQYVIGKTTLSPATDAWVDKHIAWMQAQSAAASSFGFWGHVAHILNQLQGIADGYNSAIPGGANYTMKDVFLVNFGSEIGDVDIAVGLQTKTLDKEKYLMPEDSSLLKPRQVGAHCSALIKPTEDDLFMAHDTWNVFEGMSHRIYKKYSQGGSFGTTVTMSSYPATIASGDDWYQIQKVNSGLYFGVQETTNEVFNTSLYIHVVPETVSEFIRVMTANFIAGSGEEWTTVFGTHNSGTYNNQYMVVDFSLFTPGISLLPNTLWIAEQIPGLVQRGDMTSWVVEHGYWASYNVPYFWDIYKASGYTAMEKLQGSFWSYSKYARPEIFKRNNTDVHDVATMMRMMRYNNYQSDPLSIIPNCTGAGANCATKHSAMLSIASRGDLMTVYNTTAENIMHYGPLYSFVAQGCFGAVDSKIASWKNRKSMTSYAISGPTNDQQPTFSYGSANCPTAPPGSPTTFDFPWLEIIN